jgi:drug/metabolite transporter (DMT)-like permease
MDAGCAASGNNIRAGHACRLWNGSRLYCFFQILVRSGASNVMLVTLLIPVTALFLGNVFLGEPIQSKEIIGAFIIGAGLLFIDGRVIKRLIGKHAASG